MRIIEMTLAEKLVTAFMDQLRKDDRFDDLWHAIGRDRDALMFNMRHQVQYTLDEELVKHISQEHVVAADSGPRVTDLIEALRHDPRDGA